jgi:hypothetical protein
MSADLSIGTHLQLGMQALERGDRPAAFAAFSAISAQDWAVLVLQFPMLPDVIRDLSLPAPDLSGTAETVVVSANASAHGGRPRRMYGHDEHVDDLMAIADAVLVREYR